MTLTDSEEQLLDALRSLPPRDVYADTEKKIVFKGFQLYSTGHVTDIGWKGDDGGLTVVIEDRTLREVLLTLDGSRLELHCSCHNYPPDAKCEHIVCALLIVVHTLKPNLFRLTREPRSYGDRLTAGLLKTPLGEEDVPDEDENVIPLNLYVRKKTEYGREGATPKDAGFRLVIERADRGLGLSVERDGVKVSAVRGRSFLPPGLEYLMNNSRQEGMAAALLIFLKAWGNRYPILYRSADGLKPITWTQDMPCETYTEIDAAGDEMRLRKLCTLGTDQAPAEILGRFALNTERGRISYIRDRTGWAAWERIYEAFVAHRSSGGRVTVADDNAFSVPRGVFRDIRVTFSGALDEKGLSSLALKVDGVTKKAEQITASGYRIMITRRVPGAKEFLVNYECTAKGHFFTPPKRIMSFVKAVEWGRVPASVRTRTRKPLLYETFFRSLALEGRRTIDEALRAAINDETFDAPQHAILARRVIREFLSEVKVKEATLHFLENTWRLLAADTDQEGVIFTILYGIFGSRLFERVVNNIEMVVREDELLRHINRLYEQGRKAHIDIFLDGRPVEEATWEFAIDATDGTIDWFEIRPEIRCNGQLIGRELWEQALAGRGVIHSDGSVRILDEKALLTLSAIARFSTAVKGATREIVSVPRLKIIDLFLLRKEGVAVKLTPHDEEVITHLTRFRKVERRPLPKGLKTQLRDYQKEGYYWLSFLYEHGFGACLADDMGLGKTIQAICLLGAIKEGKIARPASTAEPLSLIVVPPSLIFNWEQELARFYPDLRVSVYRGKDRSIRPDECDLVLTSYGLILRDIEKLKKMHFNVIVFDEAQTVKNVFAGSTGAVRQLRGFFKMVLTGTPVENHIGEYFSIMDLVLPGLLGDYREFRGKAKEDLSAFLPSVTERTKPFVLRRTKEHILKELPPKTEHDVFLELTEKQKAFYNRTVEEVRATIDAAYQSKASSQAKIIALTAIMRLRQICLTPELLSPVFKESPPKIEFLTGKLEELQEESHSALVFSQFTSFLDIVEKALNLKGFRIFRLDGSTPVVKRKAIVEGFQACADPAVFLLSLKAGGQGLNLTRASYVFHLDPWWNPAVENQASDRSHRIGQKNKVIVTRIIMRHTVEEKMVALKQRKMGLYRALMETPEKSSGKSVTREDFDFLLGRDR